MKESVVRKNIQKAILEAGGSCHIYHATPYGEVGHPDLYGTLPDGRAFYIEVKVPGWTVEKASKREQDVHRRQLIWMERESKQNAIVGVATCPQFALKLLGLVD